MNTVSDFFLNEKFDFDRSIYVYGSGSLGHIFICLAKYFQKNLQIVGFLDSFKSGFSGDFKVIKFDDFDRAHDSNILIVVTSAFWLEIVEKLEKNGITNYVVFNHALWQLFNDNEYFDIFLKNIKPIQSQSRFERVRYTYQNSTGVVNQNDTLVHPQSFNEYECAFAADVVRKIDPQNILDIGSHRLFLLGLTASKCVTSIDVRQRLSVTSKEKVITSDARKINLPAASHDMIISLCALEHFGLGCYGDSIDLDADLKAVAEFFRVLVHGGHLVITIPVSRVSTLNFNSFRVYSKEMIRNLFHGFSAVEERLIIFDAVNPVWDNPQHTRIIGLGDWEDLPYPDQPDFHLYMGHFVKQ